MKIWIFGAATKDVFIYLNDSDQKFERGDRGESWLELAFDGTDQPYVKRDCVYGGALVAQEVFTNFQFASRLSDLKILERADGSTYPSKRLKYRYVLCRGHQTACFDPAAATPVKFVAPEVAPDWIYISRSAHVDSRFIDQLEAYRQKCPNVRVAFVEPAAPTYADLHLADHVDFLLSESPNRQPAERVCVFNRHSVDFADQHAAWNPHDTQILTDSLAKETLEATLLAAVLTGASPQAAIDVALLNLKHSSVGSTLALSSLQQVYRDTRASEVDLATMAAAILAPGKGILAADESGGNTARQFAKYDIPDDEPHRHAFRDLLITTPELGRCVNAVILFDETTRQLSRDGDNYVHWLTKHGIVPGVKVDQGLADLPNSTEKYTRGLRDLDDRLRDYFVAGLRFAKWRAAFTITPDGHPSDFAIEENCRILAEYARICQENSIVPIVEPEVVRDGDHGVVECAEVTAKILDCLFKHLAEQRVNLRGCILKCNMAISGLDAERDTSAEEVGRRTSVMLRDHVPEELAGIVFLSGGQSPEMATANLSEIIARGPYPWPVTFSFARALQNPALEAWHGDPANVPAAQFAFLGRLKANAAALRPWPRQF